jgi:Cys-rich four helix bundle protein (predicted Tat secretion target)
MADGAWGLDRRGFLAGGLASAALIGALARAARSEDAAKPGDRPDLAELSNTCVDVGETCLSHCLQMMSSGDTTLAACARSVYEMTAVCGALGRLARTESKQLPALAAVCKDVCDACEAECRKHAKDHAVCASCADACKALSAGIAAGFSA